MRVAQIVKSDDRDTGATRDALERIFHLGWKQGFLGGEAGPGYVLAAVLAVGALTIALIGPGRYSVDGALGWSLRGNRWGVFALALGAGLGLIVLTAFGPGFGGFDDTPPSTPAPGSAEGGDLARWCERVDEVRQTVDSGGSIPDATLDDFADAAPDGIRAATQTAAEAFKESIPDAFERPEVGAAVGEIEAFAATNCR